MWASEQPLNATQARRGVYLNTGSIDRGADPDWDHKNMLYKGKRPNIIDETTGIGGQYKPGGVNPIMEGPK